MKENILIGRRTRMLCAYARRMYDANAALPRKFHPKRDLVRCNIAATRRISYIQSHAPCARNRDTQTCARRWISRKLILRGHIVVFRGYSWAYSILCAAMGEPKERPAYLCSATVEILVNFYCHMTKRTHLNWYSEFNVEVYRRTLRLHRDSRLYAAVYASNWWKGML